MAFRRCFVDVERLNVPLVESYFKYFLEFDMMSSDVCISR